MLSADASGSGSGSGSESGCTNWVLILSREEVLDCTRIASERHEGGFPGVF